MSGGPAGRTLRPAASPRLNRTALAINGATNRDLSNRRPQSLQNRLLVQKCHRARAICAPHSAQKFGLYIVRNSIRKDLRTLEMTGVRAESTRGATHQAIVQQRGLRACALYPQSTMDVKRLANAAFMHSQTDDHESNSEGHMQLPLR